MTKIRFIGDIHGKFTKYQAVVESAPASVQLGDFGIGFAGRASWDSQVEHWFQSNPGHRMIRGNHDNPARCKSMSGYITDGTVEGDVMYVGGAWSIDRDYRQEGIDWWPDEELSTAELYQIYDSYMLHKPRIMATHDCPTIISYELFIKDGRSPFGSQQIPTRTAQAFQSMWEAYKPDLWIFGHWHKTCERVILGTRFICLNELDYVDVDLNTAEIFGTIMEFNSHSTKMQ